MPKPPPPAVRKRAQFLLRTLLIAVLFYGGLWAATFEISIWQLASRSKIDPGKVVWVEEPGGHVRVRYFDESGKQFNEEGFTVSCWCPFYFRVIDDETPECSLHCLWVFGWIVELNHGGYEDCASRSFPGA